MDCGGCIRSGYRLVALPGGGFCVVPCGTGPTPPVPTPPVVDVDADAADPTGMTVTVTLPEQENDSSVLVDWGDGSPPEELAVGASLTHTYASPGSYDITVTSTEDPDLVTVVPVTVPMSRRRTWADVKTEWATWGDIDVPTWSDLLIASPTP